MRRRDLLVLPATVGIDTWLVAPSTGKPFTNGQLGHNFRLWCNEAGLPDLSAHGLRKACFTRLAERGASPHQIKAWSGHATLQQVERYTRDVEQLRLSLSAGDLLKGTA